MQLKDETSAPGIIVNAPPAQACGGGARVTPGSRILPESIPLLTQTTAIDLDVTDGCNLGCVYCFKNLDKPNNMTLDTAKDSIEWLFRASGNAQQVSVNFMGGEPTLRFKMLKELVVWGNRRGKAVGKQIGWSFTSNLTLWNDEIRAWVDANNIGVLMSIDGHPDVQDAQRPSKDGKPKADVVAKWAKSLLKTRPKSTARLTIAPKWVHRLYESCIYLWENIGFTSIAMADSDYENWSDELFIEYENQLNHIVSYLIAQYQNGGGKEIEIFKYYIKRLIAPRHSGEPIARRNFPCGAGYNYNMIDDKGTIWPCHRFDGAAEDSGTESIMKLGNIYTDPYNEVLSNSFRNFNHSKIFKEECKTCSVEPICGGFCPAANLQHGNKNNIYKPADAYCRLKWIMYDKASNLYDKMLEFDSDQFNEIIDKWNV